MNVIGYKSAGHDGAICCIDDGLLTYCIEGEKDSGYRHAFLRPGAFDEILEKYGTQPSVVCGDSREFESQSLQYQGTSLDEIAWSASSSKRHKFQYAAVPHELSHITCAFALSHLQERQEFYALVWEGYLGRFYYVDKDFVVSKLDVMDFVGVRYSTPYHGTGRDGMYGHSAAGKIMALAGLSKPENVRSERVQYLTNLLLDSWLTHRSHGQISLNGDFELLYRELAPLRDQAVDSAEFVALCKSLQDGIFKRFYDAAKRSVSRKLPLLISGGCALNCEWNTQWRNCGLFSSVFVPPVPNDCGIAIGSAAALHYLKSGTMKVRWSVYAGENFVDEDGDLERQGFRERPFDIQQLAEGILNSDWVVAWIQGKYEMGPRALCHRSLIAAPFKTTTRDRLNEIKNREYFRPVAPVCIEEDVSEHFEWQGPSPYMLYFQRVQASELGAVCHVDGTARLQTLNATEDSRTYDLLRTLKEKSGFGVACNTSLNFLGKGFINRTSDVAKYAESQRLDCVVIDDRMYVRTT
jgi:hydroxymethyl cephem carbamoyltransferase